MPVYWTVRAKRHLRQALAKGLCDEWAPQGGMICPGVLARTVDHLDAMLGAAFGGMPVVVQDQVIGYRRKKNQFTLLVEVFGPEGATTSGPYVVKVGPEAKLRREIRGWESCCPVGLRHDLVFLSLHATEPRPFDNQSWICLVYGDAQQFLGVNTTMTFEDAALQCIRHGLPTLGSVVFVINELYERIGHLFYSQAFADDPATHQGPLGPRHAVLDLPRFDDCLNGWRTDPACIAARNEVSSAVAVAVGPGRYLDPIDYLAYVQQFVTHTITGADGEPEDRRASVGLDTPTMDGLPVPTALQLIPRTLLGCAHGDLHGRNILVGIVRDHAMWPTVFDYEDMGPGNVVGWDFVKFETELKIRAYRQVFPGLTASKTVQAIQQFEISLAEQTESCHRGYEDWPRVGEPTERSERLKAIVLAIRRMAAQHLGSNHGRPHDWLEEYYFLLAGYGVSTARFGNLQHRERTGALISAGVATSRLSWPVRVG